MKKFFSLLTLALLTMSAWAANTYVKVTDVSQLEAGKKYILVNEANNAAMGSIISGNTPYGSKVDVAISNGVVDIDGTAVVELTLGTYNNEWTFDMGDESAHSYLVWTAGNSLNTATGLGTTNTEWTAAETGDGVVLTNKADDTRKLQYNQSSPRFACYSSNQKAAVLYVQKAVVTVAAPTLPAACTFEDSYNVVITNNEAGATLYYSTDGLAWTEGNSVTIYETTKVYAKASKDGVDSPVVSETYTKVEPIPEGAVDFIPVTDKGNGSTTRGEWTVVKDNVTMTCSDGTVYDENYRIYQGATLTFTSANGNITKIEFTGGDNSRPISNLSTSTGTLTTEASNGTWVGDANEIVFTASAQTRASQIRVYIGGEVVAAPTFDPAACEFAEPFNLTLTAEDGATIYYSYDNENWTEYTTPLNITETTTVYAKAVKDGVESTVVSATYTLKTAATEVDALEITADMGNNIDFTFTGNAGVTVQKGGYLWLRDDTGYGLIFGNTNDGANPVFTPGTMLQPGWTAKTKIYSGLMEFVNTTGLDSIGFNAAYAEPLTITELSEDMLNAYVQVLNVKSFAVSGRNVTATLADDKTMVMYNQFNNEITVPTTEGNYTVLGAVSTHDGLQLMILSIEGNFVVAPTLPASCNFEESMTVEITHADADATIMYSYDNETWNNYTEALTITETTTVYAKAVKGDIESEVVSATYTKVDPADQVTYTLVTDVAELADGDKIILVGYCNTEGEDYGKAYAMAEYRGEHYSNFNAVEVTVENNTVTTGLANVITLEANGNLWNLKAEEGYLWAAGNSTTNKKNHMRVEDEPDADGNANALIYMDTDSMSISFQGTNTRNFLRYNYNDGNPLFSCYAQGSSVQTPAYIFKAQAQAEGMRGDVNDDKAVTIGDVTDLIDYLLSGNDEGINLQNANCNLDEGVTISDVTALIDFLLSGQW